MPERNRTRCEHGSVLCEKCVKPSDAAKRFADGINGLLAFNKPDEIARQWVAVTLADGAVDSSLYDTRQQCIDHQEIPSLHFYFPIGNFAAGVSATNAEIMLMAQRDAHDAGIRITDGSEPDQIISVERGDHYANLLRRGLRIPGR